MTRGTLADLCELHDLELVVVFGSVLDPTVGEVTVDALEPELVTRLQASVSAQRVDPRVG